MILLKTGASNLLALIVLCWALSNLDIVTFFRRCRPEVCMNAGEMRSNSHPRISCPNRKRQDSERAHHRSSRLPLKSEELQHCAPIFVSRPCQTESIYP